MYPQEQQNGSPDMNGVFNALYMLASGHATTCTVFLRTDFGREGIGCSGIAGLFMILFWGGMTNSYPVFIYLCVCLLALLSQRMKTFANRQKGIIPHSRYNGYPIVSKRLFPRMSELNARGADAFLCLVIGGLLTIVDKPLGLFIMAGFLSILFCENISTELERRRLEAMRDAEIEQRYLAEQYRSGRF